MKTKGKKAFEQEEMEENVKTQMFPLGLIIVIILIECHAPESIVCVSMSTDVLRKAASGDIHNSQWGVAPVAACHLPDTCRLHHQ